MLEYSVGVQCWSTVLEGWVGEQRVWRIRLPNAQSQQRELSARARSADFVLARFRSPCVGIDMGGCAGGLGRCAVLVHDIGDLVENPVFLDGLVHGMGGLVEKHCLEPVFVHGLGSLVDEPVF